MSKREKRVLPRTSGSIRGGSLIKCTNPFCDAWFHRGRNSDNLYCSGRCAGVGKRLTADKDDPAIYDAILSLTRELAPKLLTGKPVRGPALVTADWHSPSIDLPILQRLMHAQKVTGIDTLCIIGDFMDMRAFAGHKKITTEDRSIIKPRDHARELIRLLARRFKSIVLVPGNHDYWLVQYFQGEESYCEWVRDIFGEMVEYQRLKVSEYPYIVVEDNGEVFKLVHQRTFSGANPQGVPKDMEARKKSFRDMHVITTHGHLGVSGRSWPGHRQAVSLGCMTDPERTDYTFRFPTRHGDWNVEFGIIANGWLSVVPDIMPDAAFEALLSGVKSGLRAARKGA